jgi:hypothetical protein
MPAGPSPARGPRTSPSLDVDYLASFAALTKAKFVLSGSLADDDGALHSIAFRHACFSSQIMIAVPVQRPGGRYEIARSQPQSSRLKQHVFSGIGLSSEAGCK